MHAGNSFPKASAKIIICVAIFLIFSFAFSAATRAESSGSPKWTATLQGSAAEVATDSLGNVYVTGSAMVASNFCQSPESCTQAVTVKYDPSGKVLWKDWLSTSNPGSAQGMDIALDSAGNAYVLFNFTRPGANPNGSPFVPEVVTAKYNAAGGRDWINFIDSSQSGTVIRTPVAMAVSAEGNTYVTYEEDGPNANTAKAITIKYDAAGHTIWSRTINDATGTNAESRPGAMGLDAQENVYVGVNLSSTTDPNDGEIVKFDLSGTRLGAFGRGQLGFSQHLHVDPDGACYFSGLAESPTTVPDDLIVAKFNADQSLAYLVDITKLEDLGGTQTGATLNGTIGAVTSDSAGNAFVLQRFDNTGPHADGNVISILKLDSSGQELFVTRYNQEADESGRDVPAAMAVSSSGDVYVTGSGAPEIPSGESGFVTIKYDSAGVRQWVAQYSSSTQGASASPSAMALSAGSLIVAGTSYPNWVAIDYVP